jgi:hypothetical protein
MGYGLARRKQGSERSRVSGLDGSISVDVGATPIENLIVYGRLQGFAFNHMSTSDSPNAGGAYFGMLGAGARYYFMPLDWYAGGTLSLASVRVTSDLGEPVDAHPGIGLSVETGKDWWAGGQRDLRAYGLGLRASYVRCGTSSENGKSGKPWTGFALSATFSVSYN